MHEQIKKLYDEAWAETTDHYGTMQKFAELIVRECAEFLCNMPDHGMHNYYKHASLKVKEHFGVND